MDNNWIKYDKPVICWDNTHILYHNIYIHILLGQIIFFFPGNSEGLDKVSFQQGSRGQCCFTGRERRWFCFVVLQKTWFKMILIWENNGIQFYIFKNHLNYKLRMWFYTFLLLLLSSFEWQWDSNGILTWIDPPRGVIKRGELVDFPARLWHILPSGKKSCNWRFLTRKSSN